MAYNLYIYLYQPFVVDLGMVDPIALLKRWSMLLSLNKYAE